VQKLDPTKIPSTYYDFTLHAGLLYANSNTIGNIGLVVAK